ncbi:type II secretory pathway pseudopilin PulG [Luteibacter sp. Sphag1AF]|uniref:DUF4845 domain-containing protein n=1 Tax=Luteibacter sp. Sphag1AF TaxID=2587031 RepID=UPI00160A5B8C|nr:DUF4845 domain-containing protein [Luteibacter sp. Sphag1AF]MBB3228458.1 type II secretory pathway pseudopilin PulG [Luteibacter sp. Sphag1AF]
MKSKQSGITLIGFLVVAAVLGFFAFMAMKLVPAYIEFAGVVKAMNQEAESGGDMSLDTLRRDLAYKLSFQYTDDSTIKPSDITVQRGNNGAQMTVAYDKHIPFMYNIAFLVHFEKSVQLKSNVLQ